MHSVYVGMLGGLLSSAASFLIVAAQNPTLEELEFVINLEGSPGLLEVEITQARRVLTEDDSNVYILELNFENNAPLGIPICFPLGTLEDSLLLYGSSIEGKNPEPFRFTNQLPLSPNANLPMVLVHDSYLHVAELKTNLETDEIRVFVPYTVCASSHIEPKAYDWAYTYTQWKAVEFTQ